MARHSAVTQSGRTIEVRGTGYTMRPEDEQWLMSMGASALAADPGEATFTFDTERQAREAFDWMFAHGKANVDSMQRPIRFNGESFAEAAKTMSGAPKPRRKKAR